MSNLKLNRYSYRFISCKENADYNWQTESLELIIYVVYVFVLSTSLLDVGSTLLFKK